MNLKLIIALLSASCTAAARPRDSYKAWTGPSRAPSIPIPDQAEPYIRTYLYTGGSYTDDGSGTGEHIFHNQMYVEHLIPVAGITQDYPLVIIHGQAQTGTNFLNKPDGGEGWASLFIKEGYEVFIIDQTFRGRSAWAPKAGAAEPSTYSAELIQKRFTAVQDYKLWPQAYLHTQWNGSGVMGDPVFDTFYSSNVQFINNATYQQKTVQDAGAALLDLIGQPVILMGHSQGGLMPFLIADARPELTKALIELEPTGPPFMEAIFSNTSARPYGLTDIPLTYTPPVSNASTDLVQQLYPAPDANHTACTLQAQNPPPRQLTNLMNLPILVVTTQSSYHAPYDYCTVNYLKQAGCNQTEHLLLANIGVYGNAHMMFMEKNSDQIQGLLQQWMVKL